MAKEKASVQFYYDYIEQLEDLNDKQFRTIVEAMVLYDKEEKIPKMGSIEKIAFNFIKKRIEYDKQLYLNKCLKNKANIQEYWNKQKNTNEYDRIRTNTMATDIDIDLDIDIDNKKENIKRKNFIKPTIKEIQNYCQERNNGVDPEQFYNFYESKGWQIGNNKMKDWKACVRTWEQRSKKEKNIPSWFNKKIKKQETHEIDGLLNEFKE